MKWCLFLYFIEIHLILIWPLQLFDWHNDSISSFFFFNLLGLYIESMLLISGIQLCLIQSGVLCCLIGIFRPFKVIIDTLVFKCATLLICFSVSYISLLAFLLLKCFCDSVFQGRPLYSFCSVCSRYHHSVLVSVFYYMEWVPLLHFLPQQFKYHVLMDACVFVGL